MKPQRPFLGRGGRTNAFNPPCCGRVDETLALAESWILGAQTFNPPCCGRVMKLFGIVAILNVVLSTHPVAGGLMKPRPLKPLSTQADKYITVG